MPSPSLMMQRYESIVDCSEKCVPDGDLMSWMNDVMSHFAGQVHGCYLEPNHPLEFMFGPNTCFVRFNDDVDGVGCTMLRKRAENLYGWDSIDLTDRRNEVARQAISILFKDAYADSYDGELHIVGPIKE